MNEEPVTEISPAAMEDAERDTSADYVAAGGDTVGARQLRVGGGSAIAVPNEPSAMWSRAVGLGFAEPITVALLERMTAFYRAMRIRTMLIQLAPQAQPAYWPEMCARLNLREEGQPWIKLSGRTSVVADHSRAVAKLGDGLRIGNVPLERAAEWAEVMLRAMGRPDATGAKMAGGTVGRAGWQSFGVFDGAGRIVATASLHVMGNVGHLFGGATLPEARANGAQSALIAARAVAAREAGCEWLISEAVAEKPGQHNPSLHNLLRAGLVARYQRANWTWHDTEAETPH
jgi:GNAT superfamily N-acetyltransferase